MHHLHMVTFLQNGHCGTANHHFYGITTPEWEKCQLGLFEMNCTIVHINHLYERLMRILNYERCGVSGKKAIDFSYDTPCTKAEYFGMFHGQVTVDLIWAIS